MDTAEITSRAVGLAFYSFLYHKMVDKISGGGGIVKVNAQ